VSGPRTRARSCLQSAESESRQLTLDDWADMQETAQERAPDVQRGPNSFGAPHPTAMEEASDGTRVADATIGDESARKRPAATDLLAKPEALLTRSDLRELGLERRAVDAVFRALPVVALPGYSRPLVRVEDYRELVARNTFRDDRVRPGKRAA
jgi:hypothetical protein